MAVVFLKCFLEKWEIFCDTKLREKLLAHIDSVVRNGEDIEVALDVVDEKLLVKTLGIDSEICRKCRVIWKKMQRRRLGRG